MNELDTTGLIFTIPARILRPTQQRQIEVLDALKNSQVLDPAILEENPPFLWDAEISSDLIDAYFSHMMLSTLSNFRDDAKAGVAFLPGHRHMELPFGRSFDALLEDTRNPPRTRVVASFYTIPGLRLNDITTDDLIGGLRSGILKDTSVGFHGGDMLCDLCGRSIWSWDCPHIPGLKYEVEEAGVMRTLLSTYGVHDARLSEVSSVFDGATPRAEVLKAVREAEEGRIKPEARRMIEERYRVKLPVKRSFAGADLPGKGKTMDFEQIVNQMREVLSVPTDGDVVAVATGMTSELAQLRTAKEQADKRIKELEPQAADGAQYRSDLITEALAEGVRAYGDKFDSETYSNMLKAAPLATIKRMKTDWQVIGDQRFPQGRQTVDQSDAPGGNGQQRRVRVPDSAYKA